MENLKNATNDLFFSKKMSRLTDIEKKLMVTKGESGEEVKDRLGIWNSWIHTTIHVIDN